MKDERTCFVIMPYGIRSEGRGKKKTDFDEVYEQLIREPVEGLDIRCVRCDKIENPGWIHAKMIEHIYGDDIAVVDISTLNPNVFYELGVRQALRPSVTVLIRREGTKIPFNIHDLTVIEYNLKNAKSLAESKRKIAAFIKAGLANPRPDSLVHNVLSLKVAKRPEILGHNDASRYRFKSVPGKSLCIATGDVRNIKNIDVWVSSENTNMQMARFFDRSVSSVVRYLGAKKNRAGAVVRDTIAEELRAVMQDDTTVPSGHVIWTSSGELSKSHGVKLILHVAAVVGALGTGYEPVADLKGCVTNVLTQMDSLALSKFGCKSVLFPLLGTGTAKGEVKPIAASLVEAAAEYIVANPGSKMQDIHFLAWSEEDRVACRNALEKTTAVVSPRASSSNGSQQSPKPSARPRSRGNGQRSAMLSSKRP